jgi:hypothetical protein
MQVSDVTTEVREDPWERLAAFFGEHTLLAGFLTLELLLYGGGYAVYRLTRVPGKTAWNQPNPVAVGKLMGAAGVLFAGLAMLLVLGYAGLAGLRRLCRDGPSEGCRSLGAEEGT